MRAKTVWEKNVGCDDWSDATINLHITEHERRRITGLAGNVSYINPNRIGMDFDNFSNGSHDFIPNLDLADVIQLINRLDLLNHDSVRKASRSKKLRFKLGVELDSRRKVDVSITGIYQHLKELTQEGLIKPKRQDHKMVYSLTKKGSLLVNTLRME